MEDVRQVHDEEFAAAVDKLVKFAEDSRLRHSKTFDSRKRTSFGLSLLVITAASSAFLWILLMGGVDIRWAWLSLAAVIFVPVLLHMWTKQPLDAYRKEFKSALMPRMAHLLGKLKFNPTGGISLKAVAASRILPPHSIYEAEDAFMGLYKGTKMLISEARMYPGKNKDPVFDGVFVLLLTPKGKFKGHTIVTADPAMIKRYRATRWKHLSDVPFAPGVTGGKYHVYSDQPEEGAALADVDMMELLHHLNDLFEGSSVTATFFAGNRVFLMIPYDGDMFEPGDIYMPITNRSHALQCKKEIEQILSVVDVLDVYEADSAKPTPAPDAPPEAAMPSQQQGAPAQTVPDQPMAPPPPDAQQQQPPADPAGSTNKQ